MLYYSFSMEASKCQNSQTTPQLFHVLYIGNFRRRAHVRLPEASAAKAFGVRSKTSSKYCVATTQTLTYAHPKGSFWGFKGGTPPELQMRTGHFGGP